MTNKTDTSEIKEAYGNKVDLKVNFEWKNPDNTEDVRNLGYGDADILRLVGGAEKAKARSAAVLEATKPWKPAIDDPQEIRKRIVADLVRSGKSQDAAEKMADTMLSA